MCDKPVPIDEKKFLYSKQFDLTDNSIQAKSRSMDFSRFGFYCTHNIKKREFYPLIAPSPKEIIYHILRKDGNQTRPFILFKGGWTI